jgi:uncharacterized OB-fold protein
VSELVVTRCRSCRHVAWPPRLLCPACGSPSFEQLPAGPGEVRERTDTLTPAGDPVSLVTVVLASGPWVVARTVDAGPGDAVSLRTGVDGAIEAIR